MHVVRTCEVTESDTADVVHVSEAGVHTPVRNAGFPMVAKLTLIRPAPDGQTRFRGVQAAAFAFVSSSREMRQLVLRKGAGVGVVTQDQAIPRSLIRS